MRNLFVATLLTLTACGSIDPSDWDNEWVELYTMTAEPEQCMRIRTNSDLCVVPVESKPDDGSECVVLMANETAIVYHRELDHEGDVFYEESWIEPDGSCPHECP